VTTAKSLKETDVSPSKIGNITEFTNKNSSLKPKNGFVELTSNSTVTKLSNNLTTGAVRKCVTPSISATSSNSFGSMDTEGDEPHPQKERNLHLKGEMKYISSLKKVLFVCSPV
jgi:hypothetical protein